MGVYSCRRKRAAVVIITVWMCFSGWHDGWYCRLPARGTWLVTISLYVLPGFVSVVSASKTMLVSVN